MNKHRLHRLKTQITQIVLLFTLYSLLPTYYAEAAPIVSAQELLENAEKYDGKIISFKGEVIGEIMVRGESAWVNVRDEAGAIGVFCPKELLGEIEYQGDYRHKGDLISVRGIFHRACPQHGGDTDIHAEKITIIKKGEVISHPLDPQKVKASVILAALVCVLGILYLIIRKFR